MKSVWLAGEKTSSHLLKPDVLLHYYNIHYYLRERLVHIENSILDDLYFWH